MSDICRDLRLRDHQVQDFYPVLDLNWSSSMGWYMKDHLSQPAYAGLHIFFHLLNNVEELHIVDVVDGVVGAEDPEVLLDSVVHKCSFELVPICLHHLKQLVLPGRKLTILIDFCLLESSPNCCDDCDLPECVLNPVPGYRKNWLQLKMR